MQRLNDTSMIKCHNCQTANLDTSRFCDECGTRLIQPSAADTGQQAVGSAVEPLPQSPIFTNTVDVLPAAVEPGKNTAVDETSVSPHENRAHATLVIERGGTPGTEFGLTGDESTIGRWDADNGIFP